MKRRIFLVCLFYCLFRLPIYESIAAIFWQSASYVLIFLQVFLILEKFPSYYDLRIVLEAFQGILFGFIFTCTIKKNH